MLNDFNDVNNDDDVDYDNHQRAQDRESNTKER